MFKRLLIANRGEIACRVICTARRLGLHTIAVYSDADRYARHVRLADEARHLGPAAPRESYLSIERLIEVARAAGADAIHPGYGFLSERAEFAAACAAAGIVFVGPPASVIDSMGSKSAAKTAMHAAGVAVLPGYHGDAQSLEALEAEAHKCGFPLIIKPSGGGGGKGMQIVESAAGLGTALASARRLAESAFGDPTLLLERYLPVPRHVEVQVLCDTHGAALHLQTRDCSVQRRHQKLIEEAPAPRIPDDVRERLHAAGLAVARAVGYVNAGTVEFLYSDGEFWFMEMNTRLQVEHCVTEEILGIDLVEWQLRIAAGERLTLCQDDLVPRGHAVEVRVCAEDSTADFAPSAGRLDYVGWPAHVPGVRVDAGFETGDDVSTHYDSMIGKVIGRGATRAEALAAVTCGLAQLRIAGVETNAAWLAKALTVPSFVAADLSTRFVALHGEALAAVPPPTSAQLAIAAVALVEFAPLATRAGLPSPWDARDAFRAGLPATQVWVLRVGGQDHSIAVTRTAGAWDVQTPSAAHRIEAEPRPGALEVTLDGVRCVVDLCRSGGKLSMWDGARRIDYEIVDPRVVDVQPSVHEGALVARLPGTVVAVAVGVDEIVQAGQTLIVLEAMKMEHAVLAPYAGTVRRVLFAQGDRVPEGAVLVEIDRA